MRICIVSASNVQAALMKEELDPIIDGVTIFTIDDIAAGLAFSTNQHILICDISDSTILDSEELVEQLDSGELPVLYSEANLYPMSAEQRLAWRNRTVDAMKKLAPDLASEIKQSCEKFAASKVDTLIIGSSSGGPLALKEFFTNLPRLDLAIFIVQHMPETAFGLFLRQVKDAAKSWDVEIGYHGQKVKAGQVIIVPRDVTISVTPNAFVEFKPNALSLDFHPNINQTIRSVHAYSKERTSVMILTGMGEDGAAAVRDLKGKARLIAAQDADSCASSSMPDAARETGAVQLSGTPSRLAHHVSELYGFGVSVMP